MKIDNRVLLVGAAAFVLGALSPSFIDWQQADERQRRQIIAYYVIVVGVILIDAQLR